MRIHHAFLICALAGTSGSFAQRYEWIALPDLAGSINPDMALTVDEAGNSYHAFSYLPPISVGGQDLVTWPGMAGYDIAVSKFDPQGAHLWTTTFGSVTHDNVHDIGVDASGAVYVGMGNIGVAIITEDSTFANATGNCVIKLDPAGHCRRIASFTGRVRLDAIRQEVYVSAYQTIYRLDTALATVWSHVSAGVPQFDGGSLGSGTVAARGERVAFTGFDSSGGPVNIGGLNAPGNGTGNDQAVVVVFDTAGTGLYAYQTDGSNSGLENPMDVAMDETGNVYLGIKSTGNPFQFAGSTVQNTNGSDHICALAKLDPGGSEEWTVRFQPTFGAEVYSVAVNDAGEAVFTGSVGDGGSFGSFTMPVAGGLYVAKVAPDGTPIWLKDDFGGAQNGDAAAFWMDDGPNGDFWLGLRNFAPLSMDCAPVNTASNFIVGRISDTPQVLPVADATHVTDALTALFTNSSIDADGFEWDFGDGNSSAEQDPQHTYDEAGTYTVILTAIAGTCTDQDTLEVTVLNTGLAEIEGDPIQLYPDPADDNVYVRSRFGMEEVRLLDVSGRMVSGVRAVPIGASYGLDVSSLAPGTYVVRIRAGRRWLSRTVRVH